MEHVAPIVGRGAFSKFGKFPKFGSPEIWVSGIGSRDSGIRLEVEHVAAVVASGAELVREPHRCHDLHVSLQFGWPSSDFRIFTYGSGVYL